MEIRVLGESLSHLRDVVEIGKEIDESFFKRKSRVTCETLNDFIAEWK